MAQRAKEAIRGYPTGKRPKEELEGKLSVFDHIERIAKHDARKQNSERTLLLFLMSWWSKHYNRPLKDPVLQSYSLEELLYEYYNVIERHKAVEENVQAETDKIEEERLKAAEEWADKMEEEEEQLERQKAEKSKDPKKEPTYNPLTDPANIAWMEEQMKAQKEQFGEDFGEDISMQSEDGE
jgi:hypothetical protein